MVYAIIAIEHAFWYINICWAPREVLKPLPFGTIRLGFQHLPRGPADAQKTMSDPYIMYQVQSSENG